MRAFRRRGHTCGFAVSFRERDFILGPADDTCLGLTAVWKQQRPGRLQGRVLRFLWFTLL